MALLLKIKWVDQSAQSEPHQRIRRIGGDSGRLQWLHTQAEAIESIECGRFNYYVENTAKPVRLEVAQTADGAKYLTVAMGQSHALYDLPEFPASAQPSPAVR